MISVGRIFTQTSPIKQDVLTYVRDPHVSTNALRKKMTGIQMK
jgi:hypothetical protein